MFYRSDARSFYWRYAYGIGYDKLRRWWNGLCHKPVLEYSELERCDEIVITEWINYRNNYWKDVNAYYKQKVNIFIFNGKYGNNQGRTYSVVGKLLWRFFCEIGMWSYSFYGNDTAGSGVGVGGDEGSSNRKMISFLVYR